MKAKFKPKEYIREHKGTIKKAIIIGVPTVAGVALGCRFGVIPYKQIAGTAVKAGGTVVRVGKKVPVKTIAAKGMDVATVVLDSKIAHDVITEVKREIKKDSQKYINKKLQETRKKRSDKSNPADSVVSCTQDESNIRQGEIIVEGDHIVEDGQSVEGEHIVEDGYIIEDGFTDEQQGDPCVQEFETAPGEGTGENWDGDPCN